VSETSKTCHPKRKAKPSGATPPTRYGCGPPCPTRIRRRSWRSLPSTAGFAPCATESPREGNVVLYPAE